MKASIVLATYCPHKRRYDLCARSFAEIHRTGIARHEYELIVVNNGGDHGSLIDELRPNVVLTTNKNLGQGAGLNAGIAIAKSINLAIMDDDISYKEGWLQAGLKVLYHHPSDVIGIREVPDRYVLGAAGRGHKITRRIGGLWIMRKAVYDRVGRFSQGHAFGGMWERNARRLGIRFIISKTPYIFHMGAGYGSMRRESIYRVIDERKEHEYWSTLNDLRQFNKGLRRTGRDYYLDLVERYEPSSILDLGCGFGDTYDLIKEHDLRYVGIDITFQFIQVCTHRYPDAEFMVGKIQEVPFADDSFDLVACRAVLEHLPDPVPAIREMARVGKVVVISWFRPPGRKEKLLYTDRGFWDNEYSREKILTAVSWAGLSLVDEIVEANHLAWVMEKNNG